MTDVREQILALLTEGKSMRTICSLEGMPSRETVRLWRNDDAQFDLAITRAREEGFHALAEQALAEAETATDAVKDRLKFDARRWYLGKLSHAFSEKQKIEHSGPDGAPIATTQRIERVIIDPANPDAPQVPPASQSR